MASTAQQAAAPGVRASQMFVGAAAADVVNMFRGEVNLPVDLVTLGGRNGLGVNVTAFYSSGVHRAAQRWNLTEPTDVLGLGWSMPYDRIMVEHQDSGTNLDDVFYLMTAGAPKQLVRVGVDGPAQLFQLRDHQFWRIRYFRDAAHPEAEYWEVVREDGTTYTYGRGAVQWGVRWGNWIGPSTVANGVSFPVAWNLHEVRSMAGDTMSFEYDTDDAAIGASADALYTRSCRLRRVVDVFSRTVDFTYLPKEPFETPVPRVPPLGGRNAYQYHQDNHYLDRIDVRDAAGTLTLTTRLDYRLRNVSGSPGNSAYTKRYLAGVRQEVTDGASLPGLEFDYHDADAPHPGALKSVLTPQGGRATYAYKATELPNTTLRVPITSPGTGWTPRVWHGPTYTVVTWENSTTGRVTTGVYSWNGSWSGQQDTHEWSAVPGTLRVLTGDGFFAIWYRDARSEQYRVNVLRADQFRFGQWDRIPYQVSLGRPMDDPTVSVGAGFLAVADATAGQLKILNWDPVGSRWVEHGFGLANVAHVALSSGANFCVATTYASTGRTLRTTIYYSDPDRRWLSGDTVSETVDVDWRVTRREHMLATGASFAALGFVTAIDEPSQTVKYATRLLTWSSTYRFSPPVKADGTQPLAVRNAVGYVVVNGSTVGNGQHLFRFDGARWQAIAGVTPVTGPRYTCSYAADTAYVTTVQAENRWTSELYEYDPYGNTWRPKAHLNGAAPGLPTLAEGYRTAGRELLRRTPDGTWTKVHTFPADADLTTVVNAAPAYLTYQDSGGSTHVLTLADGGVLDTKSLAGERVVVPDAQPGQILTGPGTFVTYRGPDFDKSTQLALYRVVGAAVATRLVAYPVVQVSSDTGYQTQHTTVDYDLATATYDPYGLVTQFVTVRATPGDGADGWVERVFFNGLSPSVRGVVYPPSDQYTNARTYFSQLNGQLFRARGYDADGRQVSESVNYPYTYTSGNSGQRIAGAYTLLRRQTQATTGQLLSTGLDEVGDLDSQAVPTVLRDRFSAAGLALLDPVTITVDRPGRRWTLTDATGAHYQIVVDGTDVTVYGWLEAATEYEYNAKGQLCREITENVDDSGVTRRLSRDTTYAWQAYQQLADLNCLVPVSQVTAADLTADVVTASTVTTYSKAWGPWAAHRGYEWMGTGTPDFAGWEPDADPGPGWLRARQVLAVTERAQPLAALDAGSHVAAVIYDREHRFAVATTANADPRADEACYYGFEEYEDAGGWTLTPTGLDPAVYITEGAAHSGSRRLAIPGDPAVAVGITNELTPAHGDRSYQLSCWVCTEPGFVSDPDLAAWRITVRGEQGRTATIVTAIAATDDQWRWLHQLIDPQALGVGAIQSLTLTLTSRQDHHCLLVDDIAFAPVQASLRASVYSPDGQDLRGTVDILGDSRRIAYDLLKRPVVEIGPDGSPLSMSADQLWRSDRDSFDPAQPNGSLMVALRGRGSFTDFRQGSQWQAQWQPSAGWHQTPGLLRHDATGTGTLTLRETPRGSYLLRFGLAGDPPVTEPLRLTFGGGWSVRWADGGWSLHRPDGTAVTSTAGPAGTDLLLTAWPHRVLWHVDGQLVLQHLDPDGFAGPVELAGDGALAVRWIAVGADPVVGMSWTDNAGLPYQLQRIADTRLRVSATGYDDAGRAAVSTKSTELDGEPVGYRPGLVTALDPATGAMGDCELTRAYPDDDGYPFSRTVFDPSPLGRPVEAGQPGKAFAVDTSKPAGQRHTTRTEYRINSQEPLLPDLPAGKYPVNVTVDPDGRTARVWTDRLGRTVATAQGDLAGTPGTFTLARTFYDLYGNVVRRHQPNLVDTRVSDRDRFVERTDYDFQGNPLSVTGPDLDGKAEYVYDTLGRLRFSRLPQAAVEGHLSYRRYDSLGRLAEAGTCDAAWDRDELERHADDPAWLPAPGTWLARYRYDGDGSDPRLYGRLWQAWSGPATDDAPATRTTYAYDDLGLVTSRTVTVAAYADGAPHSVAFGYDATGSVTDITYDAQLGPDAFTATMHTDGFNDLVGVTGDHTGQSTDLARFTYTPDGALAGEVLAPDGPAELTRSYRYTPPGWLASVSDRYVTETTDYTTGGPDGAGYHDGRAARAGTRFTGVSQDGFVPDFDYQYGYDTLGRLATAENNAGEEFDLSGLDYDANGNLIARTVGGTEQQLRYKDGTNRLRAIDDGVETDAFGYDRDGDITDAPPLGVSDLRYEPVSGLPAGLRSTAGKLSLEHDAAGTLLYRAGPDGQRLYVPGDAAPLALHHVDASGGHRVGYLVPGPHGAIAVWSPQGTAYVLRGRLGSTRAVFDDTGLIGAFNYLPDGGFLGTPLDRKASTAYPYLFTGAERDPATGLYLFPLRLYDPNTGRFLSTDPAGQYPSPYLYAGGDPVNGYDPSGGFAWSWPAFGAVVGGILAVAGGVILTVATGGLALGWMVLGAVVGGALIGGGIASAAYGFGHADASKSTFDVGEWGRMVGLGAAFGAAAAGLGFASAAFGASTLAAFGVETFIGTGLGALDGFVTNGSLNAYHGSDFMEGGGTGAWQGALGGFVGGAIGGALGRGPMLRTNRAVRAGLRADPPGEVILTRSKWGFFGHARVGTRLPGGQPIRTSELGFADRAGTRSKIFGGTYDPAELGARYTQVTLPANNVGRAEARGWLAADASGRVNVNNQPAYSYLTNNCATYARSALREAGIYPPLWARTPRALDLWMRTLGTRVYAPVPVSINP
ncbi:RHS repeat-associated core domain-containing protein [Streptomyces lunaelactis]|uniref:RHS repeat-associated core domain-containing protein n=1 Tax=Streptomyces lunaelactis TaxID=1535768 RepID=UPI001585A76A|nr:RHS repeat-associated core domain-containing protein [Streptomyces lunaelactis]NUJ99872.1 RHS repeat-associated core domain-containing protein [Streptomyces lunaelactis]